MRCIKKTAVIIAILVFSARCFYTQGIDIRQKSGHNSSYAVLDIRSPQSAADVYINNVHRGTTPLVIENMLPGYYNLRIEKKGFYSEYAEYLFESGNSYKIIGELKQITGSLYIRLNESADSLYVDGKKIGPPFRCFSLGRQSEHEDSSTPDNRERHITVTEGEHEIEVKKFGKQSAAAKVYVFRETEVTLDLHLQDADFELTSFSASKKRFNPYNPGTLGVCRFDFSVSAPGEGIPEVYGADSRLVYRGAPQAFTAENGSCIWDGRDAHGKILEKGVYTVYLQVRGNGNTEFTQSKPLTVTLDTDMTVPLALFSTGGLSAGIVPSIRLMPKGSLYSACTGGADFTQHTGFTSAPVFLGFAYTPLDFLEVSCAAGTEIYAEGTPPLIVQATAKAAGKAGFFRYGAVLGASYSSGKALSTFNEGLVHAGILLGAAAGPVYIGAAEQVYFGQAGSGFIPFSGTLKTGLSCSFQKGFFAAHVSAALYSAFTDADIRGFSSIHTGAELCVLIPKSMWMPGAGLYYRHNAKGSGEISFRIGCAVYHGNGLFAPPM